MPGSAKATPMDAVTRTSPAADAVGLGEREAQPVGDLVDLVLPGALVVSAVADDEGGELVPTEAGGGVPRPDGFLEAAGGLDQELVARLVAEPVVGRLEAVKVDEEHGGSRVARA